MPGTLVPLPTTPQPKFPCKNTNKRPRGCNTEASQPLSSRERKATEGLFLFIQTKSSVWRNTIQSYGFFILRNNNDHYNKIEAMTKRADLSLCYPFLFIPIDMPMHSKLFIFSNISLYNVRSLECTSIKHHL